MTTSTPSDTWQVLLDHRRALAGRSLTSLFDADDARPARLSLVWDDWLADWSKQRLTPDAMNALVAHARERNLEAWIAALFAGEKINLSELRPALHTALRQPGDAPLLVDGADIMPAIRATQARMRARSPELTFGCKYLRLPLWSRAVLNKSNRSKATVASMSAFAHQIENANGAGSGAARSIRHW